MKSGLEVDKKDRLRHRGHLEHCCEEEHPRLKRMTGAQLLFCDKFVYFLCSDFTYISDTVCSVVDVEDVKMLWTVDHLEQLHLQQKKPPNETVHVMSTPEISGRLPRTLELKGRFAPKIAVGKPECSFGWKARMFSFHSENATHFAFSCPHCN